MQVIRPQRLHDEVLDFVLRQTSLFGNGPEAHVPRITSTLENCFNESHQADLLSKEGHIRREDWLGMVD